MQRSLFGELFEGLVEIAKERTMEEINVGSAVVVKVGRGSFNGIVTEIANGVAAVATVVHDQPKVIRRKVTKLVLAPA